MERKRLLGLLLLLWMTLIVSGEEDLMSSFIRDIISTFQLDLPTIVYDGDEAPEICYAGKRVLCLQITEEEQMISIDHNDTGMYVKNLFS